MIKFKEYLNEIFDSGVDYKKEESNDLYEEYSFTIDNIKYNCTISFFKNDIVHIAFNKEGDFEISKSQYKELLIFSTVLKILKDFLQNNSMIRKIRFSSRIDELSRVKLYDALVKTTAKKNGFKLHSSEIKYNNKIYILIKD